MRLASRRGAARLAGALVAACALAACSRGGAGDLSVRFNFDPGPDAARQGRIRFVLADPRGRQVEGARVTLESHMSHPGMAPVLSHATEVQPGVYEAHPAFTMAGEWTFLVSGTLADGTPISARRQEVAPRITVPADMVRVAPDPRGTP